MTPPDNAPKYSRSSAASRIAFRGWRRFTTIAIFCLFFTTLDLAAYGFVPHEWREENCQSLVWALPGSGFVALAEWRWHLTPN
jgi:hypothetical protein